MSRSYSFVTALLVVCLGTQIARAHRVAERISGIITAYSDMDIAIRTAGGRTVAAKLSRETVYFRGPHVIPSGEIRLGERATLEVRQKRGEPFAEVLRLNASPPRAESRRDP